MKYDLIIVGAGPAGMTAALYALRAEKSVLLLEREGYGGQIVLSDCVQNYPGIPDVNGYDLADAMMEQIRTLGVTYVQQAVTGVEPTTEGYRVQTSKETYESRAVILATGVTHRKLAVPGEETYLGKGVSFCAVCDGAFFRKKAVAVVGGGNTAVQDALYLAQLCDTVYLIHRREGFRAEETLLERAKNTPNIQFLTNTVVREMRGEMRLQSLVLENLQSKELWELAVAGVFEAIGSIPQNQSFAPLVELDADGYFAVDGSCCTLRPGLFVAGDCRQKQVRQLTTAVSDGTLAALEAVEYLK
ncbi:MAG: thioredoxin-disulfide reductase [Clostridia bacterium]|nr:thioredoxin-disulfide reductase [Clostridia bacterium]